MFIGCQLLQPILRSTPWVGYLAAGPIAVGLAFVATRQPADSEFRLLPTRLAILAIVVAVTFAFDDPSAVLTDAAPSPLRRRRLIKALSAVVVASGLTALILPLAAADMDLVWVIDTDDETRSPGQVDDPEVEAEPLPQFPAGRLALEAATMIGFVLAMAGAIIRRGETEPGRIATSVLLAVYAVSWIIPDTYRPWANPDDRRWDTGAHWWWAALAVTTLATVILSWDSRVGRLRIRREATLDAVRRKPASRA